MRIEHALNWLLLVAVVFGHLVLVREVLGRFSVVAMPWVAWVVVSGLHVAAAVAVPVALVSTVGRHGARVLRGGHWSAAPRGWQAYAAVCAAAAVWAVVRPRVRRRPAALVDERAWAAGGGDDDWPRPAGGGPRAWVARAPGNQMLDVEVIERQIALPGLPPDWDGLSILHLSDLHFNGTPPLPFFERACDVAQGLRPDLVAVTGDVMDRHEMAAWLPTTLGRLSAPLGRYFILGNHDAYDDPARIRAALAALGWTDVGGRSVVADFRGRPLLVAGTERPWLGSHPDAPSPPAAGLRLLLSHAPDHFAWARSRGFDLVLAGHLHGGQVHLPLFGPVSGGRYLEGVFAAGPTVMHVSRGLGVNFPLRWGCRPEMTKVVLRAGGG